MYKTNIGKPCLNGPERRSGEERRNHSLITLIYALHGRRSLGRRQVDQARSIVERHEPQFLFVSLAIFILCCIDALLTLHLIDVGIAWEANPLMRWLMAEGSHTFLITKLVVTVFGVLILLTLKNLYFMRRIKVSALIYGTLAMYALLIKYELWLFSLI